MSGPGDSGISVDYTREERKILYIRVALQKPEREVRLADAAMRASYAEGVYGLATLWSRRVLMMHDTLRLLREEHDFQADVIRKTYKMKILYR